MSSKSGIRIDEPQFQSWDDYYLQNINLMPEEFDELTKKKNAILTSTRQEAVMDSCMEHYSDLLNCKRDNNVAFINCIDFQRQFHFCISENTVSKMGSSFKVLFMEEQRKLFEILGRFGSQRKY
ncbi:hypothetical protein PPL_10222 [Heterostelium album PN500]|uniref:Uncharacterized protein n=1 Tax=Heterostelium pallidum (strain ATCC 26659 / Pp 5 / PN500) TaxID=670386 RepID=D3BQN6_HETP5|nr:hypothetical protein PPL_10222 [Heterostelium album PN500]EFA76456.1 hypothetical protein PPL_10222 [Heterostelium album PN500]|eukprot:XP_020428588.1 hypothetical protein PPL_10222 [Heterostelium album PN500]